MSRLAHPLVAVVCAGLVGSAEAAPVPKERPAARPPGPNSAALLKRHKEKLTYANSSEWQGWPAEKAFDGNPDTSWFSASGDSPAEGKRVWVAVSFPEDVAVRRVTVLGNREAGSPAGYTILTGKLELLDREGRVVIRAERDGQGEKQDFDFVLSEPFGRVRTVRFTAIQDETSAGRSQTKCVGVAEIQVE